MAMFGVPAIFAQSAKLELSELNNGANLKIKP